MYSRNFWEEGSNFQWIYYATDNSSLEGLSEKVNIDEVRCSFDDEVINLGIRRINGRLYAGNYVGVCRLQNLNGNKLVAYDGREIILKIAPSFSVSAVDMLNALREDDEFERYLAPQTIRMNESNKEIEDLMDNELFHFYDDEDPIYLKDTIAQESSLITSSIYITMLKELCRRPLMGKLVCKEENLVGKAKGKIVISKNIRSNIIKGREDRLYCRYIQYSEDILENQILKSALHKSELFLSNYFGSTSGIRNSYREMASYCENALSHITYKKISGLELLKVKTTGVYVYYKPVISVAKMVLNEITIGANGNSAITSYVMPYAISMEKLFEMYVRAYLKKAGVKSFHSNEPGIHISPYDYKTAVLIENRLIYSNYIRGNIKPDIIIYDSETQRCAVFDVKYKDAINTRYNRTDRFQILAYGLIWNCSNIGNVFPSQSGANTMYCLKNVINSDDIKNRYYNQIEVAIDTNWTFDIIQKGSNTGMKVLEYLQDMLQEEES